mmetsp:Transcript_10298/g.42607  ORF Transcript_10298/g.42607 Transcript_10298/m.42607 type:complete len:285 (+) Transcript_10298:1729-2583(+)
MRHSPFRLGLGNLEHRDPGDPELVVVPVTHPRLDENPAADSALALPEHELLLHVVHVEEVRLLVLGQRLQVVPLANLSGFVDVRRPSAALVDAHALHVHLGVPDEVVQSAKVSIVHHDLDLIVVVEFHLAGRGPEVENLVPLGVQRLRHRARGGLETSVPHDDERVGRVARVHRQQVLRAVHLDEEALGNHLLAFDQGQLGRWRDLRARLEAHHLLELLVCALVRRQGLVFDHVDDSLHALAVVLLRVLVLLLHRHREHRLDVALGELPRVHDAPKRRLSAREL